MRSSLLRVSLFTANGEPPSESVRPEPDSEAGEGVESRLFVYHKISISRRDIKRPALQKGSPGAGPVGDPVKPMVR